MSFSVLDYYVSVRHEKSVNFIYVFYHLLIFYGQFGAPYFYTVSLFILSQAYLAVLAMSVDMI